jgi:sulfur carrier protein
MITIELNGVRHQLAPAQSVQALIDTLALPPQAMAVAVNRTVVPRQQWGERILQAADKVDIVRAIGGG